MIPPLAAAPPADGTLPTSSNDDSSFADALAGALAVGGAHAGAATATSSTFDASATTGTDLGTDTPGAVVPGAADAAQPGATVAPAVPGDDGTAPVVGLSAGAAEGGRLLGLAPHRELLPTPGASGERAAPAGIGSSVRAPAGVPEGTSPTADTTGTAAAGAGDPGGDPWTAATDIGALDTPAGRPLDAATAEPGGPNGPAGMQQTGEGKRTPDAVAGVSAAGRDGLEPADTSGGPDGPAAADAARPGAHGPGITTSSPPPPVTRAAPHPSSPATTDAPRSTAATAAADTVRYLREMGPARAVQRLAVDLDGTTVAVRIDQTGRAPSIHVQVVDDPAGRLGPSWTTTVERTLSHAFGGDHPGRGRDDRHAREQRPEDGTPDRPTAERWAEALTGAHP